MRWVRDTSGRLPERPHFMPAEIDAQCESLVAGCLRERHGGVRYPLETNDLVVLLERHAFDLDLYADLEFEGPAVEGVTEFVPGEGPRVLIARHLTEQPARENRLRTTLAHELGHVTLHGFLWAAGPPGQPGRARGVADAAPALWPRCRRTTMLGARPADWLEWQAGYASGAFLMPVSVLARVAEGALPAGPSGRPGGGLVAGTAAAQRLVRRVQQTFLVSRAAAQVRLVALGYVTEQPRARLASGPVAFTRARRAKYARFGA